MAYLDLDSGEPGATIRHARATPANEPSETAAASGLPLVGSMALIALVATAILTLFRFLWRELDSAAMALLVTTLLLLPIAPLLTPRRR